MPDTIDKEFEDIIAALREERPRIDPGYARDLDKRAADGFPKPRRRFRFPSLALPAVGLAATAMLVIVVMIGANSGGSDLSTGGSTGSSSAGGGATASEESSSAAGSSASREVAPSAAADSSVAVPQYQGSGRLLDSAKAAGRLQEQTAMMTLVAEPKEVATVGDEIIQVADQVGGFVVSSSVRATDGESGGGDFQLRVPTARLDDALGRLSRLGHVRERQQGVLDITAERNVARERLQEDKAERISLLKRLAEADTDAEVNVIKAQLRDVSARIAGARDELRRVVRRAQFAAVNVSLVAKQDKDEVSPADDGKWTPADAIRDAGRVLEVIAGVAVIIGALLVPLLLLGGLVAAGRKAQGRRGRARVLDAV